MVKTPKRSAAKRTTTTFEVHKRADLGPVIRKAARARGCRVVDALGVWQHASRVGGGLTPSGVSSIIREGSTPKIQSLIEAGRGQGMQLMDDALERLVERGAVLPATARLHATERARFRR